MFDFYGRVVQNPKIYRQLTCGETLITVFNCPLENRVVDVWSRHSYIVYVMEGRKIWHTSQGSFDLRPGSCVFVRKGASILEQFFDGKFCLLLFFVSEEFICDALKPKVDKLPRLTQEFGPVIALDNSPTLNAFFHSMLPYFENNQQPDPALLELKFREIILLLADNPKNGELLSYFCSLVHEPQAVSLKRVMEENFCFNLRLEAYAQLSNRSLSAFKRDFQKQFQTTPGKWLMEKRLIHSMHLLTNANRSVSEAAFESGFENPSHFSRSFRHRFGMPPASVKK